MTSSTPPPATRESRPLIFKSSGPTPCSGDKQLQSIRIDPEVVSKDDVEMLQDLILAAINDANRKVDEQLGQQMSGLMGGLKIPGF